MTATSSIALGATGVLAATKRRHSDDEREPLLVSHPVARHAISVGNTKYWALVKAGIVETVPVGKSTMVKYSSLKRLAEIA